MSLNEEHDIKKIYVDITTIDIGKSSVSLSINLLYVTMNTCSIL